MTPAILALAILMGGPPDPQQNAPAPESEKKPTRAQLALVDPSSKEAMEAILLEIAREYKTYVRVSDRANWAPTDCRVPPPEGVQESASTDEETHGKKLYFLFARDEKDYDAVELNAIGPSKERKPFVAAMGQVIVKESFKPELVKDLTKIPPRPKADPGELRRDLPDEYVLTDRGEVFKTGDANGLFIMAKMMEKEKPGTDAGWVYATISADLKKVTGLGRIESCMGCHVKTEHDRLFGPKWLQEREAWQKARQQDQPPAKGPVQPEGPAKPKK